MVVGRIIPGMQSVENVVRARDHLAEPALGGPGEGGRDPEAKSQVVTVAGIYFQRP